MILATAKEAGAVLGWLFLGVGALAVVLFAVTTCIDRRNLRKIRRAIDIMNRILDEQERDR